MNTQIAEILEGSIDPWGERDANDLADLILDLLKQEGWVPPHGYDTSFGVCEVCDQLNSDKMRDKGWLHKNDPIDDVITIGDLISMWNDGTANIVVGMFHKDDPVKGLRVERECEHRNYNCAYDCKLKLDTCIEKGHPLTVGEALDMLPNMVYLLSEKINDPLYRDALTTKDGGIVEVKG